MSLVCLVWLGLPLANPRDCPLTLELMWFRNGSFLLFPKGSEGQHLPDTQPQGT